MTTVLTVGLAAPVGAQELALQSPSAVTPAPGLAGTADIDTTPETPLSPEDSDKLARALDFDAQALSATSTERNIDGPDAGRINDINISGSDRPDGSSSVAIKRTLPTEWGAKVGVDLSTAATPVVTYDPDKPLPGAGRRSSGAAWASLGVNQYATIDARVDPSNDQGRLGTTLEHSIPVGKDLSVTLRGNYAVRQSFGTTNTDTSDISVMTLPQSTSSTAHDPVWSGDQAVKFNIQPTGTSLSAGLSSSSDDSVTHNRLSAEQKVYGPLHVTTSINDVGEASSSKSITAGFNLTW